MKYMNQIKKYAAPVVVASLPAVAMANDLTAEALTSAIGTAKGIVVAIGVAVFAVVGILFALRAGKSAAR